MKKVFLATIFGTLLVSVIFAAFASFQTESKAKDAAVVDSKESKAKDAAVVDSKEVQQIRELHIKGDIDAAIKKAKAYLKSQPNSIEILIRLAECYESKGELSLAEGSAKKASAVSDNKDVWALRTLAKIYRKEADASKGAKLKQKYLGLAVTGIQKAAAINPNDALINLEAAQIYLNNNNKAKALEAIGLALTVEPENEHFLDLKQKIEDMK